MPIIKLGECIEIMRVEAPESCVTAVDEDMLNSFGKFAKELKRIAPKVVNEAKAIVNADISFTSPIPMYPKLLMNTPKTITAKPRPNEIHNDAQAP